MKENKFYHDPLDQWVEDHPYLATLAGFVVGWFVIIALFTI
jgi:hypothetical protein